MNALRQPDAGWRRRARRGGGRRPRPPPSAARPRRRPRWPGAPRPAGAARPRPPTASGAGRRPVEPGEPLGGASHHLVRVRGPSTRSRSCSSSRIARLATVDQALQLGLEVGEHRRIDQLAQLLGAEQVAQQVAVERQRGRSTLGERRVALVHVDGDPAEQQGLRHRRRLLRVDRHHADLRDAQVPQERPQRRHVEHVVEALAGGLQQDRERRVLRRHRQQVGGLLALLPQRGALVGPPPRQEQGAGRASRNRPANMRRVGQVADDQLVDLVGVDEQLVDRQLVDRLGEPQDDAVVAPHHLDRSRTAPPAGPAAPSPTARAPARRTGRGCTPASRRSRRGTARRRSCGRRARRRWPRPARRGRRAGSSPPGRRGRGAPSGGAARRSDRQRGSRGRTRRAPGPARSDAPGRRRARTASSRAGRAPG